MSSLGEELKELAEKGANSAKGIHETIVEVEATNATPLVAGGPDGNTIRELNGKLSWWGLRHTAVRGVWRWWIRALLMGLLWELGYDCNYREMSRIEAGLGLGSVVNEPKEASRVVLELDFWFKSPPLPRQKFDIGHYWKKHRLDRGRISREYSSIGLQESNYLKRPQIFLLAIPRYYLLAMVGNDPRKVAEALFKKQPIPPNGVKLRVSLKRRERLQSGVDKLLSTALTLALTYGGLGQMTTRGFGRFSVKVHGVKNQAGEKIPKEWITKEGLRSILFALLESELRVVLGDLVGKAGCGEKERLPSIPALHPDTVLTEIVNFKPGVRHVWDALVTTSGSTMKINWKRLAGLNIRSPGGELHTWVLGLPRHIKRKGSRYYEENEEVITGYYFKKDDEFSIERRMVSPLRVTPFYEQGRWRAHLLMFLTGDLYIAWNGRGEEALYHFSSHYTQGKRVSTLRVRDPSIELSHYAQRGREQEEDNPEKAARIAFKTVKRILEGGEFR